MNLQSPTIIGIDILPGKSIQSVKEPHYAVAILRNDRVVERFKDVSLRELIKIIDKNSPAILAVDNIFEIAKDFDELVNFLNKFKYPPKIIQVTRLKDSEKPIEEIARELNLSGFGKLSPLETAEIAAKLASLNIGSYVEVFEQETKIIVARGRRLGQGGMSTERYRRNIQSLILRVTRKIKDALDKHGFDYDLFFRKSEYGLDGSTFIVYAPREKLYGIIKPMKGHDIQVIIKPVTKNKIEYVPASAPFKRTFPETPHRYILVGVDPGIVTGVAILNLNGYPLAIFSKRELSRNQLIRILSEYGRPVLIATDVTPPPLYVKKLASSLNAVLFVPQYTLSVEEKRKLVSEFQETFTNLKISNTHQRDALAAVLKAFITYKPKFDRLEKRLRELCIRIPINEAKVLILRGKTIKEIIDELSNKASTKTQEVKKEVISTEELYEKHIESLKARIKNLEDLIRNLEYENRNLKDYISKLEEEVWTLKRRLLRLMDEREVEFMKERKISLLSETLTSLRKRINELESENQKLTSYINILEKLLNLAIKGEIEELIVAKSLTPSNFPNPDGIKGKVIYVYDIAPSDSNFVEKLARYGIRGLIIRDETIPNHIKRVLIEKEIPYINEKEINLIKIKERLFAMKKELTEKLEKKKSELIEMKGRLMSEIISKIIEEYREIRKKELEKR